MLQSDRRNLSMMMDFYEMAMGYGYFRSQKPCNRVIFDFFYRQNPDNGGYAIFAGLEQIIDYLASEITDFLAKVNAEELPVSISEYMGCIFHAINDLEQIGDHAIKILEQAEKCSDFGQRYSEAAQEELRQIYQLDVELLDETVKRFLNREMTVEQWFSIKKKERKIIKRVTKAQSNHMERLQQKECTFEQGLTFIESLNSFSRIVNHASNIAEVAGTDTLAAGQREANL